MSALLAFLKARLAERSSRIQLVVLVLLALVLNGVVTLDQIEGMSAKVFGLVAVLGPLAGLLVPDKNHAVTDAAATSAAVDAAVAMATEAAEKAAGPEATEIAREVGALADKLGL